ncbi:MAG: beta-glucanase (GH16 family) [Cyclobacteriaceae bacterium]|jgi:beta-glucanase (GH16 family)
MKNPYPKVSLGLILLLSVVGAQAQITTNYELVWADEFDTDGAINGDRWFHQTQLPAGGSWYNGEVQHYTNRLENAFVANGNLSIVAKKETFTDQNFTKQYTSARLNSKFAFTYGRVDARAKLPSGAGTWPAIWMLGKNINEPGGYWSEEFGNVNWPATGEIDIMEHWGNNPNVIHGSLHTTSSSGATVNTGTVTATDVSNTFHIYSMIWDKDKIEFRIDDQTYYTYQPTVKDPATWPFDEPQYMLLNIAMGGIGGAIDPAFTSSAMEIDYIRIYQDDQGGEPKDTDPVVGAPATSADATNVISLFSDDYDDVSNIDFNPSWGQNTLVTQEVIEGNNTLKYAGLNYQGIELNSSIDVSTMTHLHVDFWTFNSTQLDVSLISPGPIENASSLTIEQSAWVSVDIPLTEFTIPSLNDIFQLKFEGNGTIYLDNIYFVDRDAEVIEEEPALSYHKHDLKIFAHDQWLNIKGHDSILNTTLIIHDLLGRKVQELEIHEKETRLKLHTKGVLILRFLKAGEQPITRKIINN